MSTIAVYLPAREEELLDELARELQVPRNKAIRVAITVAAESLRQPTTAEHAVDRLRQVARS